MPAGTSPRASPARPPVAPHARQRREPATSTARRSARARLTRRRSPTRQRQPQPDGRATRSSTATSTRTSPRGCGALWRIHDVFEAGTPLDEPMAEPGESARGLPDGEIASAARRSQRSCRSRRCRWRRSPPPVKIVIVNDPKAPGASPATRRYRSTRTIRQPRLSLLHPGRRRPSLAASAARLRRRQRRDARRWPAAAHRGRRRCPYEKHNALRLHQAERTCSAGRAARGRHAPARRWRWTFHQQPTHATDTPEGRTGSSAPTA